MVSKKWMNLMFSGCVMSLIVSCTTPYFGYTENQWNKLTDIEQQQVKSDYNEIIASRATTQHQEVIDDIERAMVRRSGGSREEWQNEY